MALADTRHGVLERVADLLNERPAEVRATAFTGAVLRSDRPSLRRRQLDLLDERARQVDPRPALAAELRAIVADPRIDGAIRSEVEQMLRRIPGGHTGTPPSTTAQTPP